MQWYIRLCYPCAFGSIFSFSGVDGARTSKSKGEIFRAAMSCRTWGSFQLHNGRERASLSQWACIRRPELFAWRRPGVYSVAHLFFIHAHAVKGLEFLSYMNKSPSVLYQLSICMNHHTNSFASIRILVASTQLWHWFCTYVMYYESERLIKCTVQTSEYYIHLRFFSKSGKTKWLWQ